MSKSVRDSAAYNYKFAKELLAKCKSVIDSAKFRRLATIADNVVQISPEKDGAFSSTAGATVYIFVHLRTLTGLKDPRLENVLSMLEAEGADNVDNNDCPNDMNRNYMYVFNAGEGGRIVFQLSAYFSEDSETCKRVVVGYSDATEPQPIYKLDCE